MHSSSLENIVEVLVFEVLKLWTINQGKFHKRLIETQTDRQTDRQTET
jgi:hypothetical protein